MSLSNEQWEFTKDVALLIQYAERKGYKLTLGEVYRTKEQQEVYFKQGKSKTMNSNHLKRLAVDINLFINGDIQWNRCEEWEDLGKFWVSLNSKNQWGGFYKSFTDLPHFERRV